MITILTILKLLIFAQTNAMVIVAFVVLAIILSWLIFRYRVIDFSGQLSRKQFIIRVLSFNLTIMALATFYKSNYGFKLFVIMLFHNFPLLILLTQYLIVVCILYFWSIFVCRANNTGKISGKLVVIMILISEGVLWWSQNVYNYFVHTIAFVLLLIPAVSERSSLYRQGIWSGLKQDIKAVLGYAWQTKWFSLQGRLSRRAFLTLVFLLFSIYELAISILAYSFRLHPLQPSATVVVVLTVFFGFGILSARRLHDLGLSAGWSLLLVVPVLNIFIILMVTTLCGENQDNRYGGNTTDICLDDVQTMDSGCITIIAFGKYLWQNIFSVLFSIRTWQRYRKINCQEYLTRVIALALPYFFASMYVAIALKNKYSYGLELYLLFKSLLFVVDIQRRRDYGGSWWISTLLFIPAVNYFYVAYQLNKPSSAADNIDEYITEQDAVTAQQ